MTNMQDPIRDEMVALFDDKASTWDDLYTQPYYLDRLHMYHAWLTSRHPAESASDGGRALDIGCGTFPAASVFRQNNIPAIGVDVSSTMIEIARESNRDALLYDGTQLPFADDTFSLITMISVFEFVTRPADLWKEIARVSKPNAAILMTINNYDSAICKFARRFKGDQFGRMREWHSPYTISSLTELVLPLGFKRPRVFRYSLPTLFEKAPSVLKSRIFRNRLCAASIYLEITIDPEHEGKRRDRGSDESSPIARASRST